MLTSRLDACLCERRCACWQTPSQHDSTPSAREDVDTVHMASGLPGVKPTAGPIEPAVVIFLRRKTLDFYASHHLLPHGDTAVRVGE